MSGEMAAGWSRGSPSAADEYPTLYAHAARYEGWARTPRPSSWSLEHVAWQLLGHSEASLTALQDAARRRAMEAAQFAAHNAVLSDATPEFVLRTLLKYSPGLLVDDLPEYAGIPGLVSLGGRCECTARAAVDVDQLCGHCASEYASFVLAFAIRAPRKMRSVFLVRRCIAVPPDYIPPSWHSACGTARLAAPVVPRAPQTPLPTVCQQGRGITVQRLVLAA